MALYLHSGVSHFYRATERQKKTLNCLRRKTNLRGTECQNKKNHYDKDGFHGQCNFQKAQTLPIDGAS